LGAIISATGAAGPVADGSGVFTFCRVLNHLELSTVTAELSVEVMGFWPGETSIRRSGKSRRAFMGASVTILIVLNSRLWQQK
jgi:hypothetical protein